MLVPPIKLDLILELSVDQWFWRVELLFLEFVDDLKQLVKELACPYVPDGFNSPFGVILLII
jgi:hypothetical protein